MLGGSTVTNEESTDTSPAAAVTDTAAPRSMAKATSTLPAVEAMDRPQAAAALPNHSCIKFLATKLTVDPATMLLMLTAPP